MRDGDDETRLNCRGFDLPVFLVSTCRKCDEVVWMSLKKEHFEKIYLNDPDADRFLNPATVYHQRTLEMRSFCISNVQHHNFWQRVLEDWLKMIMAVLAVAFSACIQEREIV